MDSRIIPVIISTVLCVVLAATVLIPIVSDAAATEKTFTNDGYFRMSHYETDTDITLTWTAENPKTVVVNDVAVPINYNVTNGQVTIVADTSFICRLYVSDTPALAYVGPSGGTHSTTESATYVFSNGTATITNIVGGEQAVYTTSYNDLYVPSLDGNYVMKKYDAIAYVNEDSEIFAYGMTRVRNAAGTQTSSPGFGLEFSGSIADGLTSNVWRGDGLTLSNETINSAVNSKFIDLYEFTDITATATYSEVVDGETVTTDTAVTYNYLLVPYQVTAEYSQHMDDTERALMSIIPLLVIVSTVISVVVVIGRRAEVL